MAYIPQIKIGDITYYLKDTEAREAIADLDEDLHESIDDLKSSLDDRQLIFTFGLSADGLKIPRRATTDFIPVTGDFEIYSDAHNEFVSINLSLYDENQNFIADLYTDQKVQTTSIYFSTAVHSTTAYIKVWLCGFYDHTRDLTDADKEFTRRHIKMHDGLTIRDLKKERVLSASDFLIGRRKQDVVTDDVYGVRASSRCLYKNDPDVHMLPSSFATEYYYYYSFYNSNYEFISDGSWHRYDTTPYDENTAPYFSITMAVGSDRITPVTQIFINDFCTKMDPLGKILAGITIKYDGSYDNVGGVRACENKRTFIKDGYVKILDETYFDIDFMVFDSEAPESGNVIADYGWNGGPVGSFARTDNSIRVKNAYLQCVFARHDDRTMSLYNNGRWEKLVELYNAGTLYEIVDSVNPNAIGEEIKNGYPYYYDAEMKTTVDSSASKTSFSPIKFAMITDIHDNIIGKLAETTEKQVNALADLHKKIGLDFVIVGGDLTDGGYTTKSDLLDKFTEQTKMFKAIGVPVMMLRGNHDDNSYAGTTTSLMVSRQEFFARCCAPFAGKVVEDGKTYYYQDFDDINTRVICLDFIDYPWSVDGQGNVAYHAVGGTGVWRGYSDDQIEWLLGTALNCNKRIIVTSHYSTHDNLMTAWEQSIDHNYSAVSQAMIAYNSRSSVTFNGHTYSFADKTGKVLIQVSGHSHSFGAFKDDGIVWSTTGSPSPEVTNRTYDDTDYETMNSRAYGDITEAHFNVFVCDNSSVHIISFGQMGDLDFTV